MALESATYISDLNSSNPAASDAISTADDHLRLIKSTIKATFPNIDGPVTVDQDDINGLAPLASPTFTGTPAAPTASAGTNTTQIATTAYVVAERTATGTLTNKTISADSNTLSGVAASSFVVSDASGNIDGSASQKAIPSGAVVGTTDTQTLTNKTVALGSNTVSGTKAQFNTAVTDTDFSFVNDFTGNQSLGTSGYQKLPGGLVIQWGKASVNYNNSSTSVTFPTAFSTACINAHATSTVDTDNGVGVPVITSVSTTGLTIKGDYTQSNVTGDTYWFALGY